MGRKGKTPEGVAAEYISELYDRYKGLMYDTAYKWCGAELDAEATVHDALLVLARHTDTLRPMQEAARAVYIACTVRSVAVSRHRRLGAERRRLADRDISAFAGLGGASLEEQYIERETRAERLRLLREALAELGETDRDILAGKYFARMSDSQLAVKYGITESSVRSRLSRAKKRVRRLMEGKEGGDGRGI